MFSILSIDELEHEIAKCKAKIEILKAEDKIFNTFNAPKIEVLEENLARYEEAIHEKENT